MGDPLKYMSTDLGTNPGVSAAGDEAQFQRGSAPQPAVGAPNAVTAPGGVYSSTPEGGPEHNASFLTPPPGVGGPKITAVGTEANGPKQSVG